MASITQRMNADGTTSYKAQVRIKRAGVIVYQEAKTFERRVAAATQAFVNYASNPEKTAIYLPIWT